MRLLVALAAAVAVLPRALSLDASAIDSRATDEPPRPCTVRSPSGLAYDLNPMAVLPPEDGTLKAGERNTSWPARGYDYGSNFTINFCAPVVERLDDVEGVDEKLWKNISAFYTKGSRTYSLGQLSTTPVFRGRKFVLNYTDGSPCGSSGDYLTDLERSRSSSRRKSSIISLLCDRDTVDPTKPKVGISFVGWSPDECTYFFEARSQYACGGLVTEPQAVGPGSVFGIIMLIALAVYVLGGVAYQRIVMHQRGWRQIPNYSMWAGFFSFFSDMAVICCASCLRLVPQRRGYNQLPSQARGRTPDDENRLIDNYDEEWEE